MVYSLQSIRSSSASEKAPTSDFASNIAAARAGMSIPSPLASVSATVRSWGVVVGERNSIVSDRMQDSIAPRMASGHLPTSSPIMSCITVAVQASGRITTLIGARVFSPPTSMWWSMIAMMLASLIEGGSSAGLLVSTMTTSCPAATSAMIAGLSKPQCFRRKAASVFGSPRSAGLASPPRRLVRYQAQMMADRVASVSGDLWPKTRVVMRGTCAQRGIWRGL